MRRDDVNELATAILVVVAVVLAVHAVCLHVKSARQEARIAALAERLEQHLSPKAPPSGEESLADKAKSTYEKVKSAAVKGIEAAKEEYAK